MSATDSATGEDAAIRRLIDDWAGAVRRRDVPGILRHHARDMLMFDVPSPFQSKGIAAYEETWATFFAWAPTPAVFDIREMSITAGDDVAFATAAMRCAGLDSDGATTPLDFRLTVGLRKIDGQWTICHEHHSVPADE